MQHYRLTHPKNDWHNALLGIATKLSTPIPLDNLQALQLLPVFAVVVVLDRQIAPDGLGDTHPDVLLKLWADENDWWVQTVKEHSKHHLEVFAHKEVGNIAEVCVYRYILIPKQPSLFTESKREFAAHIVDDQITAFLRRKLRPKPDYNFSVNAQGEVEGFTPGAKQKHQYIDCHIVSISQMLRKHKLACFDMDSTLIRQEVIVELAKMAGVGDEVDKITESAMRGEIDFTTSFAQRVALLKGLDASIVDTLCPMLIPQPGAFVAIATLKALGYRCVLISGGFRPFAQYVAALLGMDEYHANVLDIESAKLTGEVVLPIIDGKQKAKIVAKIADEMSIHLDEVICVGDGANDLPMFELADLGLAYRAKPIVQVKADAAMNITGLEGVLYALGYPVLKAIA